MTKPNLTRRQRKARVKALIEKAVAQAKAKSKAATERTR